jgi:hypothetical protein
MFRRVANNLARNDNGIEVRGINREMFAYQEANRVLLIGREDAVSDDGGAAQIVYLGDDLRWEPPFDLPAISSAELDRIATDVVKAFEALGTVTFIKRSRP